MTQSEFRRRVRANPGWFAKEFLGVALWSKQAEIAEAIRDHDRVAVRSSNAVGKSFLAAVLAIWYLISQNPGYVVTTASSWRGVEKVLWPEIRRILLSAPVEIGGTLLRTEWRLGEQWAAFGVSADTPENFAGFRTPYGVFVIVDEASFLEQEIYDSIMGLCAGRGSKVLLIGNPLRPDGKFRDAFSSPGWETFHISAYDSPNVLEGREVIPGLATLEWVREREAEWGKDSPAYSARVLGEFPDMGENQLIPLAWLERFACDSAPGRKGELRMGVDVARQGDDRTVCLIRDDAAVRHVVVRHGSDTMETAGQIVDLCRRFEINPQRVFIDDIGVGGGVVDRLRELGHDVRPVNVGEGAVDAERFANVRAEVYWNLRTALNPDGAERLLIPREYSELAKECTVCGRGYTSRGQIKIEAKDKIKEVLGRSPDLADALALTYAPITPSFEVRNLDLGFI